MRITVRLFAGLRERAGCEALELQGLSLLERGQPGPAAESLELAIGLTEES